MSRVWATLSSRLKTLFCAGALLVGSAATTATSAHAFDWLGRIAIDADGLASEDPKIRLASVRAMARYDIEWTREHLLAALADSDALIRNAAGRALAAHDDSSALPIIIRWLALPDSQSKQVAAEILGNMKAKSAVPALVRALGDPDPLVRVHSLVALGKIGGDAVIVPMVTRLEDEKSDVRLTAVEQLQVLKDKRAVISLVGLFRDPSEAVRIAAIEAVGHLGDASGTAPLVRELSDRAEPVRLAVITALGNLQAEGALDELIATMARGTTAIRSKAAYSLAQIARAHPENALAAQALGLLVEALAEPRIGRAAREALRNAGSAAVPYLIDHLEGKRRGDPASAVGLLREIGDRSATPVLLKELSRGRITQGVVLDALSSIGDLRALLPILALLEDPTPAVRLRAMRSLEPLLMEPSAAADIVTERLGDSELEIQLLAARYLGRMKERSSVPALLAIAAENASPRLQTTALQALGEIRDARAAPVALLALGAQSKALAAVGADVLYVLENPKTIAPLLAIARESDHASCALAIEALGATLRHKEHRGAVSLFLRRSQGHHQAQALASIEALSGMKDDRIAAHLMQIAQNGDPERRHAATEALGSLSHQPSAKMLRTFLRSQTQRIGAAAAWSLGQLGDAESDKSLLYAIRQKGAARTVNASAAMVLLAAPKHEKEIALLLLHANALVRVNALTTLGRLGAVEQTRKVEAMLGDSSWLVRIAALRSLSMLGRGKSAIAKAATSDAQREVREVAKALLKTRFVPAKRSEWKVFRIVDPLRDDRPVAQEAHFFVGSDGIATVTYSDMRGRMVHTTFPDGPFWHGTLSTLAGF